MLEYDGLTAIVLQQAEAEVAEALRLLEVEQEKQIEQAKIAAAARYELQKKQAFEAMDKQTEKQLGTEKLRLRNEILASKNTAIAEIFTTVAKRLEASQNEQLTQQITATLKAQTFTGPVELVLGEKSAAFVSTEWVASLEAVSLSAETVKGQAGFILKHQGISYNYIYSRVLEDVRAEMLSEVAQSLFG